MSVLSAVQLTVQNSSHLVTNAGCTNFSVYPSFYWGACIQIPGHFVGRRCLISAEVAELLVFYSFVTDFSSTIFSKASARVSLGFQTRENVSHGFIVFERLKLLLQQRKLEEIIILRSFLNSTTFYLRRGRWTCHLVSACWCVILFHLHSMPRCYLAVKFVTSKQTLCFATQMAEYRLRRLETCEEEEEDIKNKWAAGIFDDWRKAWFPNAATLEQGGLFKHYDLHTVKFMEASFVSSNGCFKL